MGAQERARQAPHDEAEQVKQIIVCGGRHFVPGPEAETWLRAWLDYYAPCTVHHGDCPHDGRCREPGCVSADRWAAAIASTIQGVRVLAWPAAWETEGRAAGPKRNRRMLAIARAAGPTTVIALPGGRGTADMLRAASEAGCPLVQYG